MEGLLLSCERRKDACVVYVLMRQKKKPHNKKHKRVQRNPQSPALWLGKIGVAAVRGCDLYNHCNNNVCAQRAEACIPANAVRQWMDSQRKLHENEKLPFSCVVGHVHT